MTKDQVINIQKLYEQGKNDVEISKIISMSPESVRLWRIKNNKSSNFRYKDCCRINVNKLKELVEAGKTDREIAEILGVSVDGVYGSRKRNCINRESYSENKLVKLSQFQLEALIGILLGDGSLRKEGKNPYFSCEHGIKQKDYAFHKYEIFSNIGASYKESKRNTPDKRNGIFYESVIIRFPANPALLPIYKNLYIPDKQITKELLENFSAISLAYMFMDDGCYSSNHSIYIATNCFNKESLILFKNFLLNKFNLHFNIHKRNDLYLLRKDFKYFISLIFPYLHESMYYKIGLKQI